MRLSSHFRRMTAAVACMAILLAALVPSISHALSHGDKSRSLWTEICSSAGLKQVKMETSAQSPTHGEPASAFDHCPFCQSHGGIAGLPSTISLSLQGYSGSFPLPSLFYQAPRPLFIWAAAHSRAPPSHS